MDHQHLHTVEHDRNLDLNITQGGCIMDAIAASPAMRDFALTAPEMPIEAATCLRARHAGDHLLGDRGPVKQVIIGAILRKF